MSVKMKKAGLLISWQKSFSILAPWRKGKGDRDAVPGSEVVLTKMKLFNNFHESLLMADDSVSTISTMSVSDRDVLDHTKTPEVNSHLDDKSSQPQMESGSEYLSDIFSDSQFPRLYKFESEDSGVELASGANSPSTPTSSEQSFVVHSRESSCDSCNLNADPACSSNELVLNAQNSESQHANDPVDNYLNSAEHTEERVLMDRQDCSSSAVGAKLNMAEKMDPSRASDSSAEGEGHIYEQSEETSVLNEETCSENMRESPMESCDQRIHKEANSLRQSTSSDSLKEYMDECCRLSEAPQQNSSPLGSGLDYLEHICQLIQKIGQLQEINLQLQRQICGLQKDGRMAKTKEDFFQQHCACGAASLSFQEIQKRFSRNEFLSLSSTLSDLSTIPELSRQPLLSTRGGVSECLTPPLWKRSLNRRSYIEGETCFLRDEASSTPQRRLSESYTWGRVKELVRKSKVKNQTRLGLTSSSLKMSCPQLYRPDIEPMETGCRSRKSMYDWAHHSKLDLSWPQ